LIIIFEINRGKNFDCLFRTAGVTFTILLTQIFSLGTHFLWRYSFRYVSFIYVNSNLLT